jgi:hypothetical protein
MDNAVIMKTLLVLMLVKKSTIPFLEVIIESTPPVTIPITLNSSK